MAVVTRAQEMHAERRGAELRALVDGVGITVGNRVAELLAKAFR